MSQSYEQIIKKLQAPFPAESVIQGKRKFIPVQVYMLRLEEAAANQWHWRIFDQPFIDIANKVVTVKGELEIAGATRQGIGIAILQTIEPSGIKNAILIAESESLRDACDKFLMGWKDLSKDREWGTNAGLAHFMNEQETESISSIPDFDPNIHSMPTPIKDRFCIRCRKNISQEDVLFLNQFNIRNDYCREHIPQQFINKR